ncbi:hypothetical protein M569_04994, partial [Genlisea aurea]
QETFEFLNIMQNHGFPRVMGVLTHLDGFKDVKKLRKTKQRLKHRFWTEIYDGAKLFYLSGLIHGKYTKREVHNLARFISVMKFPPLSWRVSHPYVLVDRFEDVTPPEKVQADRNCDRNVTLYGYLRGSNLKKGAKVHVSGAGDYFLSGLASLADPCPLPSAAKKKGLRDKEKLFYAPMSGMGELLYDKDAVYININDNLVQFSKTEEEQKGKPRDIGIGMVKSLQNLSSSIDENLLKSFTTLLAKNPNFSSGQGLASEPVEQNLYETENEDSDAEANTLSEEQLSNRNFKVQVDYHDGRVRRKVVSEDEMDIDDTEQVLDVDEEKEMEDGDGGDEGYSDSTDDEDMENGDEDPSSAEEPDNGALAADYGMGNVSKWKESLAARTASRRIVNLMQLVYGEVSSKSLNHTKDGIIEESEDDDEFFKPKEVGGKKSKEATNERDTDSDDCSKFLRNANVDDWKREETIAGVRDRFVTGDWSKASLRNRLSVGNAGDNDGDSDEVFGEFEDLETALRAKFDAQYYDGSFPDEDENAGDDAAPSHGRSSRGSGFFDKLKNEIELQKQINIAELDELDEATRVEIEGYRTGTYLRIEVHDVPFELVDNFDPHHPLLLGGLGLGEENEGYMQVRIPYKSRAQKKKKKKK